MSFHDSGMQRAKANLRWKGHVKNKDLREDHERQRLEIAKLTHRAERAEKELKWWEAGGNVHPARKTIEQLRARIEAMETERDFYAKMARRAGLTRQEVEDAGVLHRLRKERDEARAECETAKRGWETDIDSLGACMARIKALEEHVNLLKRTIRDVGHAARRVVVWNKETEDYSLIGDENGKHEACAWDQSAAATLLLKTQPLLDVAPTGA